MCVFDGEPQDTVEAGFEPAWAAGQLLCQLSDVAMAVGVFQGGTRRRRSGIRTRVGGGEPSAFTTKLFAAAVGVFPRCCDSSVDYHSTACVAVSTWVIAD